MNSLYADWNETPYKKKKKKKRVSKSDHKHLYEKCLVRYKDSLFLGKFCSICNKVEITNYFMFEATENHLYPMSRNEEEIRDKFCELPIKEFDSDE